MVSHARMALLWLLPLWPGTRCWSTPHFFSQKRRCLKGRVRWRGRRSGATLEAAWLVRRGGQWHGLSPSGRRVRGPRPPSARRRGPGGELYGAVRRGDLDPAADNILRVLRASDAPLIWHKHSSFLDHLREVWAILCAWQQPQDVCRLGLLHSAYSNSFVSMNCFDPKVDRPRVAALIGEEAEQLVYTFCSIDRQQLEETVLSEG